MSRKAISVRETATRLVREWVDMHVPELKANWELARAGKKIHSIAPLD